MILEENVLLAPLTTFQVGGMARYFVRASTVEDVLDALCFAREHTLPLRVLGGGSNVVIADSGFDGLVVLIGIPGIQYERQGDDMYVTVGAGVSWDAFVVEMIERGFSGLECLSGIPGTVGGAVVANLGAYGAQCSDTFLRAEVIDTQDSIRTTQIIQKDMCDFSYHDSMFGKTSGRYIVVRATFGLSMNPTRFVPAYRDNRFDMQALAKKVGHPPSPEEVRSAVLAIREQKGSLIMDGRVSFRCAGSFFHMPFVSEGVFAKVTTKARALDAEKEEALRPWAWKQEDGSYKIAPGFLLEYTEFQKGYVRDTVGISPRHTLTIINIGGARAKDIATLANDMQIAVKNIFNIELEREVEYLGEVV